MRLRPCRAALPLASAALLVALGGCSSGGPTAGPPAPPSTSAHSAPGSAAAAATPGAVGGAGAAVPRPQHVVVVVEENHPYQAIIGSGDAPYLNSLAAEGASFTASFAVSHPSEPNYLALFSGSTQGLADDSCPHRFSGPTLGSELLAARLGFAGYSESLPATGFTGCQAGDYARRHNPWVNFADIPATDNRTFAAFPTDPAGFAALPALSFVVPNVQHDMHDGTVRQGDDWLRTRLAGYAAWARTHDSLLVVTWDEDDDGAANHIPTLVVGARVKAGRYGEPLDHYRLLRTLEACWGLPPVGESAQRAPVTDIWGT